MARYRAVTGVGAHTRWWQKILSLMALGALVLVIGALIAALMGLIVVGARIMLDVIVS